jgi:hypothetical protein
MKSDSSRTSICNCIYQLLYQAAIYRIEVVGHLDANKATWFEGLTITHRYDDDGMPITCIAGEVRDQAALHSLLHKTQDLGLPLLSVKCRR